MPEFFTSPTPTPTATPSPSPTLTTTLAPTPLPRNVRVLGVVSLLNDTASEAVYPLLPTFLLESLGGNRAMLGLIEGAAESLSSLLKLVAGRWSDRASRRKRFLIAGYGLATFTRPLIGLASVPWELLVLRVADRLGKGVRAAPRDALLAESTPKDQLGRAFGFHRSMDHLGAAIGPIGASLFLWWQPGGIRWLFLCTLLPGIAVLLTLVLGVRETPEPEDANPASGALPPTTSPTTPPSSPPTRVTPSIDPSTLAPSTLVPSSTRNIESRQLVGSDVWAGFHPGRLERSFRWYLTALLVFTLGNSSDAFLLVRARELGLREVYLPVLWLAFHIVKSVGTWLAGFAADRWAPRRLVFAGWMVYAAAYIGFALSRTAGQLAALMLVYGVFYALTEPAEKLLVTRWAGRVEPGLAFGWFHLTIGIASLPASLLCGVLYQAFGPLAALGLGAALALVASLLLAAVPEKEPTAVGVSERGESSSN